MGLQDAHSRMLPILRILEHEVQQDSRNPRNLKISIIYLYSYDIWSALAVLGEGMFVEVLQSDLGMLIISQLGKIVLLFKMTTRQFRFIFKKKKPLKIEKLNGGNREEHREEPLGAFGEEGVEPPNGPTRKEAGALLIHHRPLKGKKR